MATAKLPPAHDFWDGLHGEDACLCCGLGEAEHEAMPAAPKPDFDYEKSLVVGNKVFYVCWGLNPHSGAEQWEVMTRAGKVLNKRYPITDWDPRAFVERAQMFG